MYVRQWMEQRERTSFRAMAQSAAAAQSSPGWESSSVIRFERATMSIKGKAYIVGAYEHPLRKAPDKSVAQLHAEVAKGAIEDAGLSKDDIDGYFCAGDAPGANAFSMANYMNLRLRHFDTTDCGG